MTRQPASPAPVLEGDAAQGPTSSAPLPVELSGRSLATDVPTHDNLQRRPTLLYRNQVSWPPSAWCDISSCAAGLRQGLLPTVCCPPPAACCPPPAACCQPPAACCQPPAACCLSVLALSLTDVRALLLVPLVTDGSTPESDACRLLLRSCSADLTAPWPMALIISPVRRQRAQF